MIEVKNLFVNYGKNEILRDVNFTVDTGEIICILGENGSGKSTLLKSMLNLIKVKSGNILVDEKNLLKMSNTEMSKNISYIPQIHIPAFDFSVVDVVLMGLYSNYNSFYKKFKKEDYDKVLEVLDRLNISYLADKNYRKISGGERQLVLIARALIQANKYIVMDEPIANLDYGNQIKIMEICKSFKKNGIGIVITTHNPNHALMYGDRVLIIRKDKNSIFGKADDVLTEELLSDIYKIPIEVVNIRGNKICSPIYDKFNSDF